MATPLPAKTQQPKPQPKVDQDAPRVVLDVKKVELVFVRYRDEFNAEQTQFAIVGDNMVFLLEGREMGLTKNTTPAGFGNQWIRDGIFEKLGRKV